MSLYQLITTRKGMIKSIEMSYGKVIIKNVKSVVLAECEPDVDSIIDQLSEELLVKTVQATEKEDNNLIVIVG